MTYRHNRQARYSPDRQSSMRLIAPCLFCAAMICAPLLAQAQEAVDADLTLTRSGEDYLAAVRFRRIETEVGYFDPSAPPPAFDTRETPKPERSSDGSSFRGMNPPVALISGLVLLGIGYLFVRFGGASALSFSNSPENARRAQLLRRSEAGEEVELPASLVQIQGLADRREGIVLLARKSLAKATELNGVLMQRSWTARDALRHIPQEQAHGDALRALVMTSEGVLFGEHDVTEEDFQTHLKNVLPLLRMRTA